MRSLRLSQLAEAFAEADTHLPTVSSKTQEFRPSIHKLSLLSHPDLHVLLSDDGPVVNPRC